MDHEPTESLSPYDAELYTQASEVLRRHGRPGKHSVGAALRTGAGTVYRSLDLQSRKSAICAEPGAIAAAHSDGEYELEAIIAVCFSENRDGTVAISPCGSCRELVNYHAPGCRMVFEYDEEVVVVEARDLFRFPLIQSLSC